MQVNQDKGYTHVDKIVDGLEPPTSEQKSKLDFPFDLNNLFNMQYSFDQLKAAIEYLARQQGNQQILINELLNRDPAEIVKIIERSEHQLKPTTPITAPTTTAPKDT